MTQLVRDDMRSIIRGANEAHAGLLVQRGLERWEEGEKPKKKELINKLSAVKPSELYFRALDRWLLATNSFGNTLPSQYVSVAAKLDGRLFTGLSLGGALETGVVTHHAYGMPMLPGSTVKGVVRSYFEQAYCQKDDDGMPILVKDEKGVERTQLEEGMQSISEILFGTDENAEQQDAGYLIWHDAWWLPPLTKGADFSNNNDSHPFAGEVVTVHHKGYYEGKTNVADGTQDPVPNQQIAVQGSFYFVIEGDEEWTGFAKRLLEQALQDYGMGAKGASGYGYFTIQDKDVELLTRHCQNLTAISAVDASDPDTPIRLALTGLSESILVEKLTRDVSKFFGGFGLDKSDEEHKKRVANLVWETHSDFVSSWANADKKSNKQKAYKLVEGNRDK